MQNIDAQIGIYSIASHENLIYSASNKVFKIFSLETSQLISEINAHNGFIKSIVIWPEKFFIKKYIKK